MTTTAPTADLAAVVASSDLRRLHVVTWRDLEHPDAGGSEIHIAAIIDRWAAAGLDVTLRTSSVPGQPPVTSRDGYRVVRRGGPRSVFLRTPASEALRRDGPVDGLVEVWHGVPFLAPLWARGPAVGIAHHVHADQFQQVLPPGAAQVASFVERRVAPALYRSRPLVTLSESARRELVEVLGYDPANVTVVPPGVDTRFSPGGERSADPLVLSVGRFMPQKRMAALVDVLVEVRALHPRLRAVLVGDGPERDAVAAAVRSAGAEGWIDLPGRVDDDRLVDLYRSAWVLASASTKEGWGMTVTEAGACGTPSVVTNIAGHADAVVDGVSGLLAADARGLVDGIDAVLADAGLRAGLGAGARRHAARFTWDGAAAALLDVLTREARRRSRK